MELLNDKKYEVISNPRVYVGNLESDDFETANFIIYSKSYWDLPLQINLRYKDAYNREYNENMTINLPMYSRFTARRLGLVKGDNGFFNIVLFIILIIFAFKTYKEWKKEKDIEKAVKNTLRNAWDYIKSKFKRKKK